MRLDAEGEVAQDLRPHPVAQADILESDHTCLRSVVQGGPPAGPAPDKPPGSADSRQIAEVLQHYDRPATRIWALRTSEPSAAPWFPVH